MSENYNQPVFPMDFRPNLGHLSDENLQNQVFTQSTMSYSQGVQHTGEFIIENDVDCSYQDEIGDSYETRNPLGIALPTDHFQTNFSPYGDGIPQGQYNVDHSANYRSEYTKGPDQGPNSMGQTKAQDRDSHPDGQNELSVRGYTNDTVVNMDNIDPENFNYLLKEGNIETQMINHNTSNSVKMDISATRHVIKIEAEDPDESNEIDNDLGPKDKLFPADTNENDLDTVISNTNESSEGDFIAKVKDTDKDTSEDKDIAQASDAITCISDADTIPDESQGTDETVQSKRKDKRKSASKKPAVVKEKSKSAILFEKKEHRCPTCGKVVNSLRAYEKHLNLHTDKFACQICKRCFNSQTSLDTHQKVHQGFVGKEQCNVCDKTFYDKSSLNKHTLSVHMGIKNFECDYCDRSFYARKTYDEHIRVHTGERPFKCTLCPKSYKRIADLNHHMRMHKGETKHTCEMCGEGFRRISELNRHKQRHDITGDFDVKHLAHICEWCDLRFSTAKALKEHIAGHLDSANFDKSMMQKAYGSGDNLAEGIVHDLSTKLFHEPYFMPKSLHQNVNTHKEMHISKTSFDLPSVPSGSLSEQAEGSGSYTSNTGQETLDQSVLLTATKLIGTVTGHAHSNTDEEDNQMDDLADTTEGSMEVGEAEGHHLHNAAGKFEIKVENIEEDGMSHMYIGKSTTTPEYNHDGENGYDDCSDGGIEEGYDAETDMEDYSYIIKNDDNDYAKAQDDQTLQTENKVNGTQARKRKRKGQPLRKPRKPKTMKVIKQEIVTDYEDSPNESDDIDNKESFDLDYTPPSTKVKKPKGGTNKKKAKVTVKKERIKKEPDPSSYICEECGKVFSSKFCFKKHQNIHTGIFSCGHCGKSCTSRHSLDIHEASHEGKKPTPSVCKVCDKQFYDPSSMNKHVKNVHMNYRPHACTECDRKFPERKTLVEHLRTHTGERPFKCEICGKTYKRKSELNFHIKWHTGEKNITCGECGKGFRRMSELKHHNVVQHSAERPYQCTLCMKKFTTKPQLNDHSLKHYGIKNYECQKCFKGFYTKSKLRRHLRIKSDCSTVSNLVNGLYVCRFCLVEFELQDDLRAHVKSSHEQENDKKHIYSCKVCLKEFNRSQSLKRHMKIHTQTRDYVCNTCGTGFIQKHHLVQHLRTHTGEKPYQCTICLKSFAQNATLYSHMKHHTQPRSNLYESSPLHDEEEEDL